MSKGKALAVLDKKITAADNHCKNLEKQFCKGGNDQKTFISEFYAKRSEFHRYQILKVKVH